MNMPESHLHAAADAIDQMSSTELQRALRQVKERRNARTPMEVLHQQTELESLEQDQAPYQLAIEAEAKGDLALAAHWYTTAAINDFGDASLRLAKILDALAEKHLHERDGDLATREELDLVSEACRWYSDALAAGEPEADELLEKLIDRHLGRSRKRTTPVGALKPGPRPTSPPPQLRSRTGRMTASPDRILGADPPRAHVLQDAASDQSASDRDQPGLAGMPKNHGK